MNCGLRFLETVSSARSAVPDEPGFDGAPAPGSSTFSISLQGGGGERACSGSITAAGPEGAREAELRVRHEGGVFVGPTAYAQGVLEQIDRCAQRTLSQPCFSETMQRESILGVFGDCGRRSGWSAPRKISWSRR